MSSENEEIIRRAYQRAEDKDIEGWVNSFTPDGTFTDQSIGVIHSGPDELGQTVENYALALPGCCSGPRTYCSSRAPPRSRMDGRTWQLPP
jgi:hypothetical protein